MTFMLRLLVALIVLVPVSVWAQEPGPPVNTELPTPVIMVPATPAPTAPPINAFLMCADQAAGTTWSPCAVSSDPCSGNLKTTTAFSVTTDTVIVTATASQKTYICALIVVTAAAEIVSVTEGTGTLCATGEVALAGSTTDANGMSFAANGGMPPVGGNATLLAGKTVNVDVCLNVSGSNRIAGFVTFVKAP